MAKKKNLRRSTTCGSSSACGAPSLAPDGAQAVCRADAAIRWKTTSASSALWLLSTLGGAPRAPDALRRQGRPAALVSPTGELIAFIAKREQQGTKDDEPQLYLIAPDGGEARRVGEVAHRRRGLPLVPRRQAHRLRLLGLARTEGRQGAGQGSTRPSRSARKAATSPARRSTATGTTTLPMGRVPHLHVLDVASRPRRATCSRAAPTSCRAASPTPTPSTSRPTAGASSSPSTRRPRSASTTALRWPRSTCAAAACASWRSDADWDFGAPRYSPDGERIAFVASHQGRKHTMPAQLALWEREQAGLAGASAPSGTTRCTRRCTGKTTARRCSSPPSRRAARTCGASTCPTAAPRWWSAGGWVSAFDKARRHAGDAGRHGRRTRRALHAHLPGEKPRTHRALQRRIARGACELGRVEEAWVKGASAVAATRCRCG